MPTVTETEVQGFAHCPDAMCPGYAQQPVRAIKTTRSETLQDRGGDLPFVENTWEYVRFLNDGADGRPDEMTCECGRTREVTLSERPAYQPLSGHPQNGLLTLTNGPGVRIAPDASVSEAEARIAELEAKLERLVAAKDG